MTLAGRRALVTGGGSGAGEACARALAGAGAAVTICGRNAAALARVAAAASGMVPAVCDITDEAAVQDLFAGGPFDIVIANAGQSSSAPLARTTLAEFRAMTEVNLTGTFLTLREALRGLERRGWGRIVAIASTASLRGYAYAAPYAAAKHGVLGLVRSAALEVAGTGITVNAVCPGFMDTPMTQRSVDRITARTGRSPAEARDALAATNPMRRLVPPAEVAAAVLWLCGDAASMVTGQAIAVSGGETI